MEIPIFKNPIINSLVRFIASPEFQSSFETFFLEHALLFTDESEHRLEYMEIYKNFQKTFDSHMEGFLEENKIQDTEFIEMCREAIQEEPKVEQYIDIIIASMDYSAFVSLMRLMRGRARAESKDLGFSLSKKTLQQKEGLQGFDQEKSEVKFSKCLDDNDSNCK